MGEGQYGEGQYGKGQNGEGQCGKVHVPGRLKRMSSLSGVMEHICSGHDNCAYK